MEGFLVFFDFALLEVTLDYLISSFSPLKHFLEKLHDPIIEKWKNFQFNFLARKTHFPIFVFWQKIKLPWS